MTCDILLILSYDIDTVSESFLFMVYVLFLDDAPDRWESQIAKFQKGDMYFTSNTLVIVSDLTYMGMVS